MMGAIRFSHFVWVVLFLMLLFPTYLFSQCEVPAFAKTGKTIQSFVPKGWEIKDSARSDFNNDQQIDVVLILSNLIEQDENNFTYECNRPIVILQKTNTGYILAAHTNEGVLCKSCGGIFGDPYAGISFNKNVLNIEHYAGSAWRWIKNFTFRFQQNQWQLIGCSDASYWSLGECEGNIGDSGYQLQEANFSTSKAHIVKTKDTFCKPYKDVWIAFKKKPFVNIEQFDVDLDYFPIKD
ncbi:MAG: hypothetical protein IPG85_15570 [Bacteroidetes bacterium]|nr:hypothetical protein [Bacteroidota bacterium]